MANETYVQHSKSFKKYTSEYRPEVVDAVRHYAVGNAEFKVHEDRSLLKVTSTKENIAAMLTVLRARFGALPGDDDGKEEKKAE